jgi:hypothetical protein
VDELTAERYAPKRRRKKRPDEPDMRPVGAYPQIEERRRILIGKEYTEPTKRRAADGSTLDPSRHGHA